MNDIDYAAFSFDYRGIDIEPVFAVTDMLARQNSLAFLARIDMFEQVSLSCRIV